MPTIAAIDDPSDTRLHPYRDIRDPERARTTGLFVAEGRSVVQRLIAAGRYPVRSLLLSPAAREALASDLDRLPPEVTAYVLPPTDIRRTAGFAIHQGCIALAERGSEPLAADALTGRPSTVLVLDDLADPDNVGSIFRSALALGGDAIVLGPTTADPLYRKTIRTSMGAVFDLPYGRSVDTAADVEHLRRAGYLAAALTPAATAEPLPSWAGGLAPDRKLVLLLGNEGYGLGGALLDAADVRVRIPMRARVDSINVHTAVAVVLAQLGRV